MPTRLLLLLVLAAAFAGVTMLLGWWAVPVVAFAFGAYWRGRSRFAPLTAGIAALLAWLALLIVQARGARFGPLLGALAEALRIPDGDLLAITLAFPLLLAWSAATLGEAIGKRALGRAAERERAAASAAASAAPLPTPEPHPGAAPR